MFEADLHQTLTTVCPRVYPDVAPEPLPARPFAVYQQIGGETINPVAVPTRDDVPNKTQARMQIAVWASTRMSASETMRQIEIAMRMASAFQASPLGGFTSDYEPDTRLYGARQDFGVIHQV